MRQPPSKRGSARLALILLLRLLPKPYGLLAEAPTHIKVTIGVFALFHLNPLDPPIENFTRCNVDPPAF
jgi:hypothetical protein